MPENDIGSGLSHVRLGYEIEREFAPYVGVSYDRKFGTTRALPGQMVRMAAALISSSVYGRGFDKLTSQNTGELS